MSKRIGCSISDEEKVLLNRLTKKLGKSQGEVIGLLIRSCMKKSEPDAVISLEAFKLSSSEQSEVENALINSNSLIDEVARDGLLQRSRYLNSIASKQAQLESMSDEEIRSSTFKGAANFKIEQAINTIIEHNNSQTEKSDKVCITKGIIFKLTGSNRQTINKWFADHEVMICDHNQKHSLTDTHNRKGKNFNWDELLGV